MQLSQVERNLREALDALDVARIAAKQPSRFSRLFRRRTHAVKEAAPARNRRDDLVMACLGVTLGLICALFPWYIFFNQDQFGVTAMGFGDNKAARPGIVTVVPKGERIGPPLTADDIPSIDLDLFSTGTLQDDEPETGATGLKDQPFPGEPPTYRLVHVANGRAMIEDETGLWVVQRGSPLPDNSTVASIEQRKGKWVLVTSANKVVELTR